MTIEKSRLTRLEARHPADSLIDVAAIRRQLEQDAITLASYGPPEAIPKPSPSGDPEIDRIRRLLVADNRELNDFISTNEKEDAK